MCNLQCNKCQNSMRLQSESLTEEFWVCENNHCNKWLRRSTVIHDSHNPSSFANPFSGIGAGIFSIFNNSILKPSMATMQLDREKTNR